ncbi:insulin-like growth factor binding protein [Anaeramoeba flamelloides]|uniref:Insulin-like growth factor binding protein n=1 Tax=Anaeramoeba flamelloides TaxID=1746091 RepID=A0ABQ8YAU8_9EUKA|nr:insulin-like growth factor binding protein [Anaeramoeba flamelloides]
MKKLLLYLVFLLLITGTVFCFQNVISEETFRTTLPDLKFNDKSQQFSRSPKDKNFLFTLSAHILENVGQTHNQVKYICDIPFTGKFYFTNEKIVYASGDNWVQFKIRNSSTKSLVASEELKSKTNYYLGQFKKTNISNYRTLVYKDILKNVDLEFTTGPNGLVKSSFYLQKAEDIKSIVLDYRFDTDLSMRLDNDGSLLFERKATFDPVLRESPPVFFQNNRQLSGEYILNQVTHQITFQIDDPDFDPNQPLIIDPNYATYIAGDDIDLSEDGTTDSNHCGIITGYTQSINFPVEKAYQDELKGTIDGFVVKTCDGSSLEWSTYIGSTSEDKMKTIIADSNDDLLVTGYTTDSETADRFPTTSGAYKTICSETTSRVTTVTKFNSTGSLMWSTYLCTDEISTGYGVTLSPEEDIVYVAGFTRSIIPQEGETGANYECDSDSIDSDSIFVVSLNSEGSSLLRTKCYTGNKQEFLKRLISDSNYLYISGFTTSTSLPTTSGVVMEDSPTSTDEKWFMGKLNIADFSLVWMSYYGGTDGQSFPLDMALKSDGNIWISGKTSCSNFPLTADATQKYYEDEAQYAGTFTLISADGSTAIYSSLLGGYSTGSSDIWAIGLGENDEVVVGMTYPPYGEGEYDYDFGKGAGVIVWNHNITKELRKIRIGTFRVRGIGFYQGDPYNFTIVGSSTSSKDYNSTLETTENAFQKTQIDLNDLFAIHIYTKCAKGSYGVDQGCLPCPNGTYSDEIGMTMECKKCLEGTFGNETGLSVCYDCEPGTATPQNNQKSCAPCSSGHYTDTYKSTSCKECDKGTFNDQQGLSYCDKCDIGTFNQESGLSTCDKCDFGTYANVTGLSECYECDIGTYNNLEGQENCFECDTGKYQDSKKSTSCKECVPGTFADEKGLGYCKNCTGGTYNSKYQSSTCEQCEKGKYNPGDGSTKCFDCNYGTFANVTGLAQCYECESGTYSIDKGTTRCELCDYGTYSDITGKTSATCTNCPMGTYNSYKGVSSVEGCIECPMGTFSETLGAHSNSICQMCPKGTYNQKTGSQSSDDCLSCPAGTIANGIQATTCLDCPVGQEPDDAQDECQDCQAGFYSEEEGQVCDPCAAGYFNNEEGLTYCVKCSSVDICLGNNTCEGERDPEYNCAKCISGYFLLNDQCQSCPPPVQAILIIATLALILILIYVFRVRINNFMKSTRNPIKGITFTFFQILAGIIALDLTWPVPVRSNLRFVSSAFNLEFDTVVSPECYQSFTYYDTWLIIFLIPLVGTVISVGFWFYYLKRYKLEPERLERRKIRLVHHYSVVLKYLYLPLVKLSIDPFDLTYQEEDEKYTLDSNPKLSPSDEKWQSFLPLFITSVVLYVIGIPVFFFIVVYKAKKANFTEWYEKRFGWMYRYFKPNRYWWELVEIFFKFMVIVTAIMFNVNSTGQAWFVLGLLAVLMILVLILRPHKGEYPKYVAEDRLVVGLLLVAFSVVTLAIDFFNSIPFFILFPIGFIIVFDGIKENLRKFLAESKLIRAEIQMQAVELKNNNINLDDFLAQEGEDEKKSQKKNNRLIKQINEMNKGLSTMKKTIKRAQKNIQNLTQENEQIEEKNKIFWEENEQLENKVKGKGGDNVTSNTNESDEIDK